MSKIFHTLLMLVLFYFMFGCLYLQWHQPRMNGLHTFVKVLLVDFELDDRYK
jgi:hypothetical protein